MRYLAQGVIQKNAPNSALALIPMPSANGKKGGLRKLIYPLLDYNR